MNRFLIIPLLFLMSCSGSLRVNQDVAKHGNVPVINPVETEIVSVDRFSRTAFFVFYAPIILGAVYLTYRTFKKDRVPKP
jgi:hypothetical protein